MKSDYEGKIVILTRATIRLSKLKSFWKNVDSIASQMANAKGFITSYGIGEIPWVKQATVSIWESKEDMKNFAYKMHNHAEVIKKTRQEKWYSEDMFVRFKIKEIAGKL
jgi:heme-degrading monooxygenase HmoA